MCFFGDDINSGSRFEFILRQSSIDAFEPRIQPEQRRGEALEPQES